MPIANEVLHVRDDTYETLHIILEYFEQKDVEQLYDLLNIPMDDPELNVNAGGKRKSKRQSKRISKRISKRKSKRKSKGSRDIKNIKNKIDSP